MLGREEVGDFPALYPQESYLWNQEPWKFHPDGGESMAEVYSRIWEAATEIAARHFGQSVLIASHGCAIRNLLCMRTGGPLNASTMWIGAITRRSA